MIDLRGLYVGEHSGVSACGVVCWGFGVLICFFVCLAEDGMRGLVRSRWLGVVYKRRSFFLILLLLLLPIAFISYSSYFIRMIHLLPIHSAGTQ